MEKSVTINKIERKHDAHDKKYNIEQRLKVANCHYTVGRRRCSPLQDPVT